MVAVTVSQARRSFLELVRRLEKDGSIVINIFAAGVPRLFRRWEECRIPPSTKIL